MRFFRPAHAEVVPPPEAAVSTAIPARTQRKPALVCATCRLSGASLVYMENGRDYCPDCAVLCWKQMRLRPAGRRAGDLTLAQLLS